MRNCYLLKLGPYINCFTSLFCSFGDYVSDQEVAPVRETCAQALGAAFKYMHPSLVHETLNVLLQMQVNTYKLMLKILNYNEG